MKNKIQIKKKEDIKKRGLASSDFADSLAMSFAYPVAPKGI
jgi:phage terminase large subunit